MSLEKYFKEVKGIGILSTASRNGEVDSAIYSTPHIIDDKTVNYYLV